MSESVWIHPHCFCKTDGEYLVCGDCGAKMLNPYKNGKAPIFHMKPMEDK